MQHNQPIHRRPPWAKSKKSLQTYMRKDLALDRPTGDFGADNFSYDETFLEQWVAPKEVTNGLPSELKRRVLDWQAAGAAVCTSLKRIKRLRDESLHRGYPEVKHTHLSRRTSCSTSAQASPYITATATQPPMPYSAMPTPERAAGSPLILAIPQQPMANLGMESPPFTPLDTDCPGTPTGGIADFRVTLPPNPSRVRPESSPLVRRDSALSTTSVPTFNETAWETYLNSFRAELDDLRSTVIVRLKGFGYTIDRLCVEHGAEPQYKAAIDRFREWWLQVRDKVRSYQVIIDEIEEPDIFDVKMDRAAKGMFV